MGQVLAMNVSKLRSQNMGNLLLQRWEAETRDFAEARRPVSLVYSGVKH